MKLGLGTAQFGLDYGISNPDGRTAEAEVRRILEMAEKTKVTVLDTACLYGKSEEVLGRTLHAGHRFQIVTKTPKVSTHPIDKKVAGQFEEALYHSLRLMQQDRIYGLLAHDANDLLAEGGEWLFDAMIRLRDEGLINKLGASVYTGQQIDALLDRYPIELIQLPVSLLDQRLIHSGHLQRLTVSGIEVHARSVFLQGLIFLQPNLLPPHFAKTLPLLNELHNELDLRGVTPEQAALHFIISLPGITTAVCGVNTVDQLAALIDAVNADVQSMKDFPWQRFSIEDTAIVNPAMWPSMQNLH
ncbi:MAG: aldo/keto reductase [Pseudomonadota bacterium]